MEFFDSQTFGMTWKGKYAKVMRGLAGRKDNSGKELCLPKGAIGYVVSATPGTILVLFGKDLLRPPRPKEPWETIANNTAYPYVVTFSADDWFNLDIRLST